MKKLMIAAVSVFMFSAAPNNNTPMYNKCFGYAPMCMFDEVLVCLCDSYGFDCHFACVRK